MKLLSRFFLVLTTFFSFATFAADTIDPFTKEFFSRHFRLNSQNVEKIKYCGFEYEVIFLSGKRDSAQKFFDTLKEASIPARFCDGTNHFKEISVAITEFQKDKLLQISELTPRRIEARITPSELVKIVINAAKIKRLGELLAMNADSEAFLSKAREIKSLDLSGKKDVSIYDVLSMLQWIFSWVNDLNLSGTELRNEGLGILLERLPSTAVNSLTIDQNSYDHIGEAMIEKYFTTHQNVKIIYDGFTAKTVKEIRYTSDCFESHYGNFKDRRSGEHYSDFLDRMGDIHGLIAEARANCERQGKKGRIEYTRVKKLKQASSANTPKPPQEKEAEAKH